MQMSLPTDAPRPPGPAAKLTLKEARQRIADNKQRIEAFGRMPFTIRIDADTAVSFRNYGHFLDWLFADATRATQRFTIELKGVDVPSLTAILDVWVTASGGWDDALASDRFAIIGGLRADPGAEGEPGVATSNPECPATSGRIDEPLR